MDRGGSGLRTVLRDSAGRTLTRKQLSDRSVFLAATSGIPGYDPSYTYDRTVHVRMARDGVDLFLRPVFNRLAPSSEDSVAASLLLERKSLATMVAAIFLAMILVRTSLRWYWNPPARNTPASDPSESVTRVQRFLRFHHGVLISRLPQRALGFTRRGEHGEQLARRA